MINLRGNKEREVFLAIGLSLALALVKGGAAFWTGALSLLASALDSLLDCFVSGVNLLTLALASKDADADHPFGHGKAESLAGLFQSLLIFGSAAYLVYSSFLRFQNPSTIGHLPVGMMVMVLSMGVGLALSYRLRRMGMKTGSLVLKADALHYAMDLYTQGGILVALVLIQWSGWTILDPIVTVPVALYIGYEAGKIGKEAIDELMDREASSETLTVVQEIVGRQGPEVVGMHNFKTRRAGGKRFIQLHLHLVPTLSFVEAHQISERVVGEIRRALGNVQVIVHADPEGVGLDQSDLC